MPQATFGLTPLRVLDVNIQGTVLKAALGSFAGGWVTNVSSGTRYLKIYDKASAPLSTDTPLITIAIPTMVAINLAVPLGDLAAQGVVFVNGIGVRGTTGVLDADVGAPAPNDVILTALIK